MIRGRTPSERLYDAIEEIESQATELKEAWEDFSEKVLPETEMKADPRADGWLMELNDVHEVRRGYLHKSDGWTQALVDQLVRLVNEGLPL